MKMGRRTACLSALAAAFAVARPALAQARGVVAYTAFSDGVTALTGFKARSGADVRIVAAGSGELVRRLLAKNVAYGLRARRVARAAASRRVQAALERFPDALAGGQKQRVGLAQADGDRARPAADGCDRNRALRTA